MIHVLPINDIVTHDDVGAECACNPVLKRICQQCEGSDEGCWNCDRGMAKAIPSEAQVVVHNAADGRE